MAFFSRKLALRDIMQQYVLVSFANFFFNNVAALHIQPHMYMFTLLDESH